LASACFANRVFHEVCLAGSLVAVASAGASLLAKEPWLCARINSELRLLPISIESGAAPDEIECEALKNLLGNLAPFCIAAWAHLLGKRGAAGPGVARGFSVVNFTPEEFDSLQHARGKYVVNRRFANFSPDRATAQHRAEATGGGLISAMIELNVKGAEEKEFTVPPLACARIDEVLPAHSSGLPTIRMTDVLCE
jgi:hypothetical protein